LKKLAIVLTHPIQYYAPVFKLLSERNNLKIKVFYTWGEDVLIDKYDPSFGKSIVWDIPVLDGYDIHFTKNIAKNKGSSHYNGIINPDLIEEIKEWKPDAILIYGWNYHSHLKLIRYFKGKLPVWFRGDSTLLDDELRVKKIIKYLYLKYFVFRFIDKAFYVGSNNKKYFKYHGLKEKQLIFSPHAIDNNRFSEPRKEEAFLFRKNLGIASTDVVLLFVGKFQLKKNPTILLNAFSAINQTDIHLVFVGNGELEIDLKNNGSNLKNKDNIHFISFQNQIYLPVIYQAADIFCLPSKGPGESWGLAVNEAMAAGNAIIVSDRVGCAADLVRDGVNGFVFNHSNQDQLKEILLKLVENKDQIALMGNSSKKIIENWTFENQVQVIENELINLK